MKLTAFVQKEKEIEMKNIAVREVGEEERRDTKKYVGAHVSTEGGVPKGIERMHQIKGEAASLFLKNQKTYASKPYTKETIATFRRITKGIEEKIIPHASYLINLAQGDKEKAGRSYALFLDELKRCEQLAIPHCNFHPGSNVGRLPIADACALISENINRAHKETKEVIVVIENMAGQGNVVGSRFEELREIIKGVKDKTRVGVCLDTCHLFGAGYNITTRESFGKVMKEFKEIVGLEYLKAVHLNDSKEPLGSKRDRHESIGKGLIGLEAFAYIMNSDMFNDIPMVLETPDPTKYAEEINLLYSLCARK